ncbi:MAG TPA: response regulator [Steroidobacteraceae bacterium]|nr:response regulator [Steroidobacteraceae bacterium]
MRAKKPSKPAGPPNAARSSSRAGLLTPNQVADRLLVAPVTVRLWASRGLLRSEATPGGHRRFREQDVEEFIARRREMQDPDRGPSRMLIIDDDAEYAQSLARMLALHAPGLHIETAQDGFAAGIKCEALRPDIVTLDLHMPDMNGIEVCRLLRSMFGRERPRIVVLSGLLSEESQRRALEAGADACVSKSAPAATLLQQLGIAPQRRG